MNLALEHATEFNNQAVAKLRRRTIVINHEEDNAYGWVSYHPERPGALDIAFHDEPQPLREPFDPNSTEVPF
jgi:hypothetical protein